MPRSAKGGTYTPARGRFAGETFRSYRQYRNALERSKGGTTLYTAQRRPQPVRSRSAYERLSPQQRQAQQRAASAVADMKREGLPLVEAARRNRTTTNTVRRYGGHALERRGSRLAVKERYRMSREMKMLTAQGVVSINVADSKSASLIAGYWNAVDRYLSTGDASGLRTYRGKSVRSGKREYPFITDTATLDMFASYGELRFESIYREAA